MHSHTFEGEGGVSDLARLWSLLRKMYSVTDDYMEEILVDMKVVNSFKKYYGVIAQFSIILV